MRIVLINDDGETIMTLDFKSWDFHRRTFRDTIMSDLNEKVIKYEYEQTAAKINRDCQNG